MRALKRRFRSLLYTAIGVGVGAAGSLSAASCGSEHVSRSRQSSNPTPCSDCGEPGSCGPCGTPVEGDVSISGDLRLDGFFVAFLDMQRTITSNEGDFQSHIVALANTYGVAPAEFSPALVDQVIAAIKADVTANTSGGASSNLGPVRCFSSIERALRAQAECEAKSGCDVRVIPEPVPVLCEGTCAGKCRGACTGAASCVVRGPVACSGLCEGTCETPAPGAPCEGICHGTCTGSCSLTNPAGECVGGCKGGSCVGFCEVQGQKSCAGTCYGTCFTDPGAPECTGDVDCAGACDGNCIGSCAGDVTPLSASLNCPATADCDPQSRARATAGLDCSPPFVDFAYTFRAGTTAAAQASFIARLGELEAHAAGIVQGAARLSALVGGKVDGKTVFSPPPLDDLSAAFTGFSSTEAVANFDIAPGRLPCVVPAFNDAKEALDALRPSALETVAEQTKFVAFIANPG